MTAFSSSTKKAIVKTIIKEPSELLNLHNYNLLKDTAKSHVIWILERPFESDPCELQIFFEL